MRKKSLQAVPCGIARAVDLLGDPWTVVIIREALFGITAFDDFVKVLTIPRNTLAARLDALVSAGLMRKSRDTQDGRRSVYELEPAGQELWVVLLALQQWGNKWCFDDEGAPSFMADHGSKRPVGELQVRSSDGDVLTLDQITMIAGPSATPELEARFRTLKKV
ncbi:MAG: helix-turn-helix domain-containing protein [Pseudomonadota bacterium]